MASVGVYTAVVVGIIACKGIEHPRMISLVL